MLIAKGGKAVAVYLDLIVLINFIVDFLLLLGTNRLCGYPPGALKCLIAGAIGGVYGGACLLPGFHFLGNPLWRLVCLFGMGAVAFGLSVSSMRRVAVFVLLTMALGGVASGFGGGNLWKLILSASGIYILCRIGVFGKTRGDALIPVELSYGDKKMRIFALRDTGNSLCDPITGAPVLVVGEEIARAFTGLTTEQLKKPVESVGVLPGLRLIPYRSVGQNNGMLLALRFPKVKIGKWQGSSLVAFAPQQLSQAGQYQALTGGLL